MQYSFSYSYLYFDVLEVTTDDIQHKFEYFKSGLGSLYSLLTLN